MNKRIKAFTLVEMLIVVIILGVLAAIIVPKLAENLQKSRNVSRETQIAAIKQGLEVFYTSNVSLPEPDPDPGPPNGSAEQNYITIVSDDSPSITIYQGVVGEKVAEAINLDKVPKDPARGIPYIYSISSDKKKYGILGFDESGVPMYRGNTPVVIVKDDSDYWVEWNHGNGNVYKVRNVRPSSEDTNNDNKLEGGKDYFIIKPFVDLNTLSPVQAGSINFNN